jgi:hypothetical protein
VTLLRDIERGHSLVAADLVPGDDADELVLGGYSKRITVLVARRRLRRTSPAGPIRRLPGVASSCNHLVT